MILIDDRAGSKELILYPPLDSLSTLCRLSKENSKSADVAFLCNGPSNSEMLGIEVKSIDDLVDSLLSARLQGMDGQLQQMVEDYSPGFRWLLIYGQYRPSPEMTLTADNKPTYALQIYRDNSHRQDRKSGWYTKKIGTKPVPYGYVEGFLSGPALPSIGFQSHRVNTIEEAAVWIYILYHTWTKQWHEHKSLRTISKAGQINGFKKDTDSLSVVGADESSTITDTKMDRLFKLRARFANLFTGMGYERSIAAARYFEGKSIEDMVLAKQSEWAEIEIESKSSRRLIKLGQTIAKSIRQSITEK